MKSAFLIAGTKSGAGKTVITLGVMAALMEKRFDIQPFKCGPDFIDPSLHKLITGRTSSNIDFRMCGEQFCRKIFHNRSKNCDIAVVEGVMGLFDGEKGSGAYLAQQLSIPVVLIIDVRSSAQSVAAVLHGFESYRSEVKFAGVIFNFVGSERHKELIKNEVEANCKTPILGFIPRCESLQLPERHLGLHMGEELKETIKLDQIVTLIKDNIDLNLLRKRTEYQECFCLAEDDSMENAMEHKKVTLAVARDEAFCFYYQDNLDLFKVCGIDLQFFSPIHDSSLPQGVDGLYFGGGYPELYAQKLSKNIQLRHQVNEFSKQGGHVYGECGGFMYLTQGLYDIEGEYHDMCNIFPIKVKMNKRMRRLGYREITLKAECFLGDSGTTLHGHEFHYSDVAEKVGEVSSIYSSPEQSEGYCIKNTLGSYVHLHFGKNIEPVHALYTHLLKSKLRGLKW